MNTLRDNPICPCGDYLWQEYYWRRPSEAVSFEQEYWLKSTDPDGTVRYPLTERDRRIEDQKADIDFINSLSPGRILDVGCGAGFALSAIDSKWSKFGTEISRIAAKKASHYAKIYTLELCELKIEDFDVILMQHTLRYVDKPVKYIQEVYRKLKPGGYFILAECDFDSGCARRFKEKYRLLHDKAAINLFTSFSLVKLLEDTGFRILKLEYPFFETRWFTKENLLRLFATDGVSPPFYGNFVTVYARKENNGL